jgi:hypothetical protein
MCRTRPKLVDKKNKQQAFETQSKAFFVKSGQLFVRSALVLLTAYSSCRHTKLNQSVLSLSPAAVAAAAELIALL